LESWQGSSLDFKPERKRLPETARPARHPLALWLLGNARWIWPILVIAILFAITRSYLRNIDYRRVRVALHGMDPSVLMFAGFLTLANFGVMGIYDVICFRGIRVRAGTRWWIGTLAFAWSNFLTLGPLAGPAIRFWLYRPFGVGFSMLHQAIFSIIFGYGGALLFWIAVIVVPLPGSGWGTFAVRSGMVFLAAFLGGWRRGRFSIGNRFPTGFEGARYLGLPFSCWVFWTG
jgi:hypothetical protein